MKLSTISRFLILLFLFIAQMGVYSSHAQDVINKELIEAEEYLLFNPLVQIEATSAVNDMYNFKFQRAANQFNWFREKYPEHPLPYFLLGLNEWWKMMPNLDIENYDDDFFKFMDLSIDKARKLYREDAKNIEASFFLAAAYAFKSRLHAERKHWTKATFNGKSALKFLRRGRELNELSPELMFGDALYNYYSVWIPKNYPLLKPVLMFFKKGDQKLGLEQLEQVAENAFYTRTEAQYFLMRIYRNEEKAPHKALPISRYLAETFPDNPYFQRYYASVAYTMRINKEVEKVSKDILQKIEDNYPGYEGTSGRYAAYFLGSLNLYRYGKKGKAKEYYQKAVAFAEDTKHLSSGYYHSSLTELGRMADKGGEIKKAKSYYAKVKKNAKRKSRYYKEAKGYLKKHRRVK